MIRQLLFILLLTGLNNGASAEDLGYHQTLYDLERVETREFSILLAPADDDARFSITLRDEETGFSRRHEFYGQGANDPAPYLLEYRYDCGVDVILLTIEYPWRHDLPQYVRVLDTFAFRDSDFEFIDDTFGPLTDIALMDSTVPDSKDLDMQPPILVECLPAGSETPFRFVENPVRP
ncbi:hypothetical protein ACFSKJ_02040 [Tabrizicola soli]|uniref:hypothetical protein n=1 Tax=Tabrizicola soli TaxID=2185115 RepID=UPI00362D9902